MRLIWFFLCLAMMFSCRSQNLEKVTVQYKDFQKNNDELALDIYPLKSERALPVVVFVHGGAWILGDKANKIENKVELFRREGYVLVSVNYRLSSFLNTKVQYPSHPNDVADAVEWIVKNIGRYGGDPGKVVLFGHSAGAQIVSLLGTSEQFLPKRGISLASLKGVVSVDTEGYDVAGMGNEGVKIYKKIFGDNPEHWREASPMAQVTASHKYPPFLVITRGEKYRKQMSENFVNKLRAAGADAELLDADPYSHFESNNKIGAENENIITPKLLEFLKESFSK